MATTGQLEWGGSLHQSFRLLPIPTTNLRPFLEADGMAPDELLRRLPYDKARAGDPSRETPDAKRYRDPRQVYQTAGLLYESIDGLVHVTALGKATLRWLDIINMKNSSILGRHAAYALAACQLRNPTQAGRKYDGSVTVFPFAFIWRAMLALDGKISSDELNRAIFRVTNEQQLVDAIDRIAAARQASDVALLGAETISDEAKNDRIIPWIALASFGWTLFPDKRSGDGGYYEVSPHMQRLLLEASLVRHVHREFATVSEYVEHVAHAAVLPKDLR